MASNVHRSSPSSPVADPASRDGWRGRMRRFPPLRLVFSEIGSRIRVRSLGILLLSTLFPGGLQAHVGISSGTRTSGPSAAPQQMLEEEAIRFSRAWGEGDVRGLESMLAAEGIRLHVVGGFYPSVEPRRAAKTLRAFLDKYRRGEVEVLRVSQASGTAPRGFADIQWRTQVAGTGEIVIFTLFVAFTMEETGWTVTEIRVLS